MDALMATVLCEKIDQQIRENSHEITKALEENCEESDSAEVIYGKMTANAVAVSVKMSVSFILDMLIYLGMVEPLDEEKIRKNIMSVVK